MIEFRYKSEVAYMLAATEMILSIPMSSNSDYSEYNDLMDEFMYFCEVSGSGE